MPDERAKNEIAISVSLCNTVFSEVNSPAEVPERCSTWNIRK